MILISHRGNINGPNPKMENKPNYIDLAIDLGYDVEVDVWALDGTLRLGHDYGQQKIPIYFLMHRAKKLWVHCKNHEAFEMLSKYQTLNIFWHQTDDFILTSKGYIWCHPDINPLKNSVAVLPTLETPNLDQCYAICSDNLKQFEFLNDKSTYSSIS